MTLGEDAEKDVSLRVVADHARALAFLVGDGVLPSNEGRGYVLRRILRRASRHGILLGVERPFLFEVADAVVDEMRDVYPELEDRRAFITDRVRRDEERFLETLSRGLELLEDEIAKVEGCRRRGTVGRFGLPALRHLRLPGGPHPGHPAGAWPARRRRWLRGLDAAAAGARPQGLEGVGADGGPRDLRTTGSGSLLRF